MRICILLVLSVAPFLCAAEKPVFQSELIFPLEHWHNHSSSIVELPNGDLFACWYNGSGERTADDVKILASRRKKGAKNWSTPFLLADTPGFPDANPILFVDSRSRLWLSWPLIIANRWETALERLKISTDGWKSDPPVFDYSENLMFVPHNFEAKTKQYVEQQMKGLQPGRLLDHWKRIEQAAGDKYFSRMGWMPRTHPLELPSGRVLVPLYSDGYDFSLIAITDDGGKTWSTSEPIVSLGGVQPALVRRRDGSIVAYMRDNGGPPKRIMYSESKDDGVTWSPVVDIDIPNPGSSVDAIGLRDGSWLMVMNDTEKSRNSLVAWLSDDEGKTWKWKKQIELDKREKDAGSFHYPSLIQAHDGLIHLTYSYFLNDKPKDADRKSIKHAQFNVEWVKAQ